MVHKTIRAIGKAFSFSMRGHKLTKVFGLYREGRPHLKNVKLWKKVRSK